MAITIKGIKVNSINVGEDGLSASYSLISSTDNVLATQSIGGYNGMKVEPSPATKKLLQDFQLAYKKDIQTVLGLDTE